MKKRTGYFYGDMIAALCEYPKPRSFEEFQKRMIESGWKPEEIADGIEKLEQEKLKAMASEDKDKESQGANDPGQTNYENPKT